MVVVEVLVVVLIVGLGVVTTIAAYVGLLGMVDAARVVRCDRCGHLGLTSTGRPLRTCAYCQHGRLLHPLYTLHHVHDPIRMGASTSREGVEDRHVSDRGGDRVVARTGARGQH
jgi:hypothetical protein